jgi:GNAT superfamily N-acetyltransferase
MITINKNIQLQPILATDVAMLQGLMQVIYPPAYKHFWKDNGDFYINKQYSEENILKELLEENAAYYFILFNGQIIGNLRFLWDEKLAGISEEKQVKLHRIYLLPKTQSKGIGKAVLLWLEEKAKQEEYQVIWLDAMDEQQQAFQFYKKSGYQYHSHVFLTFELMLPEFRKMNQIYKVL